MEKYKLENLDCANCALKIENILKAKDYVNSVSIDFATLSMFIDTDNMPKVIKAINKIEPDIKVSKGESKLDKKINVKYELLVIGLSFLLLLAGILNESKAIFLPNIWLEYLLLIAAYVLSGWKVIYNAIRNIIKGNFFNENFLMTVSTIGAFLINAKTEAAGVMLFYKIGELLQELSLDKSRKSIKSLIGLKPDYANLITDEGIKKVSPEEVRIDDLILVKPGERIPIDGIIINGSTQLDTSTLTGESVPRLVNINDEVLSGMINKNNAITVKTTKLFTESSISKILSLIENASHKKAKTEKFITTFAKYYTPVIIFIAGLIAIIPPVFLHNSTFGQWFYRALVILVISCPCALVISIPLGYFGGIGCASKRGILIKGSNYIDTLTKVKTVVFDKTGTLTKGVFKVTSIVPYNGFTKELLLENAAEAEYYSNHPIGLSIRESYGKQIDVSTIRYYREIPGAGIKAEINGKQVLVGNDRLLHDENIYHSECITEGTVINVVVDGKYAGYIIISDELKDDSRKAIADLKKLGIKKTVMLTGDSECAAKEIIDKIHIDEYFADLLPEGKVIRMEEILKTKDKNHKIAFIGDGTNDAPVLALSDVGLAMGETGTDAAIEAADIVLLSDSIAKVTEALKISLKTKKIVYQNIIFALSIKLLFVFLGSFGLAGMWEAVFADVGVSIMAILNSMRTLKI